MRFNALFLAVVSVTLYTVTESIAHADILPPGTVNTCTYDKVCTAGSECVSCNSSSRRFATASRLDSGQSDGNYVYSDSCAGLALSTNGFTSKCSWSASSSADTHYASSIWCRPILATEDEDSGTSSSDEQELFANAYRCPDNGESDASIKTDAAVRDASTNLDATIRDVGTKFESAKEKNDANSEDESESDCGCRIGRQPNRRGSLLWVAGAVVLTVSLFRRRMLR